MVSSSETPETSPLDAFLIDILFHDAPTVSEEVKLEAISKGLVTYRVCNVWGHDLDLAELTEEGKIAMQEALSRHLLLCAEKVNDIETRFNEIGRGVVKEVIDLFFQRANWRTEISDLTPFLKEAVCG